MKRKILAAALLVLAGCSSWLKKRELEAVAKDWCLVIRASQVMPVYPLTEDLQPGDVFLVRMPIEDQTKVYDDKGFLALDVPVMRLEDVDYETFYAPGYFTGEYAKVPHPRPRAGSKQTPEVVAEAPRAAFPTYTFDVTSGGGLKLALPVQGVPVGLSLLKTDAASGSVSIRDARTYGASSKELLESLEDWARQAKVRAHLVELARSANQTLFLRVVTRVYLAAAVDVSLAATGSSGAQVDAGQAQKVDLDQEADRYGSLLKKLNEAVQLAGGAGGSLSVASATSRTVTLRERFDRPLVIGYIGFDVPIGPNGDLGAPLSTIDLLRQGHDERPARAGTLSESQHELDLRWLELEEICAESKKGGPKRALQIARYMAEGLPAEAFAARARELRKAKPDAAAAVLREFWWDDVVPWVSEAGASGSRYDVAIALYDAAWREPADPAGTTD